MSDTEPTEIPEDDLPRKPRVKIKPEPEPEQSKPGFLHIKGDGEVFSTVIRGGDGEPIMATRVHYVMDPQRNVSWAVVWEYSPRMDVFIPQENVITVPFTMDEASVARALIAIVRAEVAAIISRAAADIRGMGDFKPGSTASPGEAFRAAAIKMRYLAHDVRQGKYDRNFEQAIGMPGLDFHISGLPAEDLPDPAPYPTMPDPSIGAEERIQAPTVADPEPGPAPVPWRLE